MAGRKKLILSGVGAVVLAAAVISLTAGRGKGTKVETALAQRMDVEDHYTEEGVITFGEEYQVMAQASGPIGEILVDINDLVEEGQLLFTIDSTDYQYEKQLAESTLAGLRAQLEFSRINQVMTVSPGEYLDSVRQALAASESQYRWAESVYQADQVLFAYGDISKVQLEADTAAYEAALSAWQQAKGRFEESEQYLKSLNEAGIDSDTINERFYRSEESQLTTQIQAQETAVSQLEDQISKCQVQAKEKGIITQLPVKTLSVIQAGQTGVVLNSRGGAEAQADVLTNIAPYIKKGDPVEVVLKLRGKDQVYEGRVSQIYDYASRGTSSLGLDEYRVHVKVALPSADDFSDKDGYGVSLKFLLYQKADCLTIPSSAVFQAEDQYFVYQIQNGQAVKIPVEVEYQTGIWTVIVSGIEEGEEVIDQADSEGIYEGAKVRR
ncbi:MAG: biotin/lipoyl-binding protein [Lachnospiraceae bacterium]|nr:biotin/lipoyl-binding protein [Lachnospiraceae bacterium]